MRTINYDSRKCEKCLHEYSPKSSTQKWCDNCLTKACIACNKPFHIGKKTKINTAKFCSRKCQGEYRSKNYIGKSASNYRNGNGLMLSKIICFQCGQEATKKGCQVGKWDKQFCSRECQIKHYRLNRAQFSGENSPKYTKVSVNCEWCGKSYKTCFCTKDEARFCSKQCRSNWQSDMMKGENHHNWQGGITGKRALDMTSREYKNWRHEVFKRDDYTCKKCGDKKGGNLQAHHIKEWAKYPDLRHKIDNGITYCEDCHIKIHSKGWIYSPNA